MEEKGIRQEERATATTDMGKEGITAQENRETGVSPAGKEKERRKFQMRTWQRILINLSMTMSSALVAKIALAFWSQLIHSFTMVNKRR